MDVPSKNEWIAMDWQTAQMTVVNLLHYRGYMAFYEKTHKKGRSDGVVIRKTRNEILVGIIEVKHYKRTTKRTYINAIKQGCNYLPGVYEQIKHQYANDARRIRIFVAAVFTYDYPATNINTSVQAFKNVIPIYLQDKVDLILCSGLHFIDKMYRYNFLESTEKDLSEYM